MMNNLIKQSKKVLIIQKLNLICKGNLLKLEKVFITT